MSPSALAISRGPVMGGGSFYPTNVPGCVLCLDSDSIVGFADGEHVLVWSDRSPSGCNMAQANPDKTPWIRLNKLNGHQVVRFDGLAITEPFRAVMQGAVNLGLVKHIFAVCSYGWIGDTPTKTTFDDYKGLLTDDTGDAALVGNAGDSHWFDFGGSFRFNRADSASRQAPMSNTAGLVSVSYSTGWTLNPPMLGQDRNFSARYWYGDVAFLVAYDSVLSTTNRDLVETYLHDTYALP